MHKTAIATIKISPINETISDAFTCPNLRMCRMVAPKIKIPPATAAGFLYCLKNKDNRPRVPFPKLDKPHSCTMI